jgi:hypothetical protein
MVRLTVRGWAWQAGEVLGSTPTAASPITTMRLYKAGGRSRLALGYGDGPVDFFDLGPAPVRAAHLRAAHKVG